MQRQDLSLAGVKCDKCGEEMIISDNITLASNPPMKNVECPGCGHRGYMVQ